MTVRSFSVEPIGVGVGLLGLLFRLTLAYEGDAAGNEPLSVIVKLPVLIDETRHVARVYRFDQKEVGCSYRELVAETSLRTPEVYFAGHVRETDDFVLLMEDVSYLRGADQVAGRERDDGALAAIAALARHHASFWDDPRPFNDELGWLPARIRRADARGGAGGFRNLLELVPVEFMGDDLAPDVKAVGDWVPGVARRTG